MISRRFLSTMIPLTASFLLACTGDSEPSLVGRWETEAEPRTSTTEFREDGTMTTVRPDGKRIEGTYQADDDSTITVAVDYMGDTLVDVWQVDIRENRLHVVTGVGRETVLRRVTDEVSATE